MTLTEQFIRKLEGLQEGERSRLRRLAGQPLDATLPGFDLFTGLWWPLRNLSPRAPERRSAWLIAKLHSAVPVPHVRGEKAGPSLAHMVGGCEPPFTDRAAQARFRARFDALLCSPLSRVETHLHWALSVVAEAVEKRQCAGLDWAQLLNDVWIWDRGADPRGKRDIRDIWAEDYLDAADRTEGRN